MFGVFIENLPQHLEIPSLHDDSKALWSANRGEVASFQGSREQISLTSHASRYLELLSIPNIFAKADSELIPRELSFRLYFSRRRFLAFSQ